MAAQPTSPDPAGPATPAQPPRPPSFADALAPVVVLIGVTTNQHIRGMLWTVIPSFGLAFGIFLGLGFAQSPSGPVNTTAARDALAAVYHITPWNLLPVAVLIAASARRVPPFLAIFGTALFSGILASFTQPAVVRALVGKPDQGAVLTGIEAVYKSMANGHVAHSSNEIINALFSRGGCGAYMSGVLGVPTVEYLPYAFFNLINPLLAVIFGFIGFRVERLGPAQSPPAERTPAAAEKPGQVLPRCGNTGSAAEKPGSWLATWRLRRSGYCQRSEARLLVSADWSLLIRWAVRAGALVPISAARGRVAVNRGPRDDRGAGDESTSW